MIYKGSEPFIVGAAALANQRGRRITVRRPTGIQRMPDGTFTMGFVSVVAEPRINDCAGAAFPLGNLTPS